MSIVIDADKLWKAITTNHDDYIELGELGELIYDGEMEAPTAQKTGWWISTEAIDSFGLPVEAWKCSECGKVCNENWRRYPEWNYCPNCGAYMKDTEIY